MLPEEEPSMNFPTPSAFTGFVNSKVICMCLNVWTLLHLKNYRVFQKFKSAEGCPHVVIQVQNIFAILRIKLNLPYLF